MEIQLKKMGEIKRYHNNPRKNQSAVEAVAASIRKYGFLQPIVIDQAGIIVAGDTRYQAAQAIGLEAVPCVVASDLTPEEVAAYRLVDNRVGELAEWDYEKLADELLLADFGDYDFGITLPAQAVALDIDSPQDQPSQGRLLHCPKCGFAFEVDV